jgi:hypothetical protein
VTVRGRGRVADDGATDLVQKTVMLPRALVRRIEWAGHGNFSRGLRKLLLANDEADLRQRSDDDD